MHIKPLDRGTTNLRPGIGYNIFYVKTGFVCSVSAVITRLTTCSDC